METITFYSYKGGVGRTLALSNIAHYLSKFGLNVCVLDFDLEAPGLHYKFNLPTKKINKGVVNYIHEFYAKGKTHKSLKEFSYSIEKVGKGEITIIPAGNILKAEYWQALSEINWNDFLYTTDIEKQGIVFLLEFQKLIEKEIKPDFLLIDSRTGVTEIGGFCTSLFADKVVFLLTNNSENLEGSKRILTSVINAERLPHQKPIKTYFALTRIPTPDYFDAHKEDVQEKINQIKNKVINKINEATKQPIMDDFFIIHSNRELELLETLIFKEEKYQNVTLLNDYLKLFAKIIDEKKILPELDNIINDILKNVINDPDKTQLELENFVTTFPHSLTFEKLLVFYNLRNIYNDNYFNIFNKYLSTKKIKPNLYRKYFELFENNPLFRENKYFNLVLIEEYNEKNFNKNSDKYKLIKKLIDELRPDEDDLPF